MRADARQSNGPDGRNASALFSLVASRLLIYCPSGQDSSTVLLFKPQPALTYGFQQLLEPWIGSQRLEARIVSSQEEIVDKATSPFHAGFSSALKSTRMLAHRN